MMSQLNHMNKDSSLINTYVAMHTLVFILQYFSSNKVVYKPITVTLCICQSPFKSFATHMACSFL